MVVLLYDIRLMTVVSLSNFVHVYVRMSMRMGMSKAYISRL